MTHSTRYQGSVAVTYCINLVSCVDVAGAVLIFVSKNAMTQLYQRDILKAGNEPSVRVRACVHACVCV